MHELKALAVVYYNVEIILEDSCGGNCLFSSVKAECFQEQFKRLVGGGLADSMKLFEYEEGLYCLKGVVNVNNTRESLCSSRMKLIFVNGRCFEGKEVYQTVAKKLSCCR